MSDYGTAVIAGGINLAGTAFTGWSARQEAEKNRDFQERMSSTAVQRRMEDLRKAGINPLLAGREGASSPGGSMANVPDYGNVASSAVQGAQLAMQKKLNDAQVADLNSAAALKNVQANSVSEKLNSEIDLLVSQAAAALATADLSGAQRAKVSEEMLNAIETRNVTKLEAMLKTYQLDKARVYRDYYRGVGQYEPYWSAGAAAAGATKGLGKAAHRALLMIRSWAK